MISYIINFVTELFDLGERKIIKIITNILTNSNNPIGIGDDCAVIEFDDDYILLSTDMISKKTHIPGIMSDYHIGWFLVAINLSDIAAKGGKPLGILLAFGFPGNLKTERLKEIVKGANDCVVFHKTSVLGGDMKENSDMVLSGFAIGSIKKDEYMGRQGAQVDDVIVVTGDIGKAAAGYLSYKNKIFDENIINGLIKPMPRIKEGRFLASTKKIHCCMDLSDGLSSSLYQLNEINPDIGFQINSDKLPISKNLRIISDKLKNNDLLDYSIHFGGDYELLFTLSQKDFNFIKNNYKNINITAIGKVTDDEITIVYDDVSKKLPDRGYEHFRPLFFKK